MRSAHWNRVGLSGRNSLAKIVVGVSRFAAFCHRNTNAVLRAVRVTINSKERPDFHYPALEPLRPRAGLKRVTPDCGIPSL